MRARRRFKVVVTLDVLGYIEIGKAVELAGDVLHILTQLLDERLRLVQGLVLVLVHKPA